MEAPPPAPPGNEAGDESRGRSPARRCTVCGDLYHKDNLVNTRRGWMCRSDFYLTGEDNEDP
jgi:hypothetical protein